VGAGTVGSWTTEVELANPSESSIDVQLGGSALPSAAGALHLRRAPSRS
jgi:hypothetical protein